MSSLYKREDSTYWWWGTVYKGRRLRKSTRMSQKHLARKVQTQWDLNLMLGNLEFLGIPGMFPTDIKGYVKEYLDFIAYRKSEKAWTTASGVLRRFTQYLDEHGIRYLEDITVKMIDGYIDWLSCAPKTKRNHLIEVNLLFDQAVKEEFLKANPARRATLPRMVSEVKHRPLEPIDLQIIWEGAGSWRLFFAFLLHTGLRAGDVAMLTYGNIDRQRKALISMVRKSRRIHEFPLAETLLLQIPIEGAVDEPLFPSLYSEDDQRRNDNLTKPRKFMQALLESAGRHHATLHSFRTTFNTTLQDLGVAIEDRQILMAHAASQTTKIYSHPNLERARELVNRITDPAKLADPVCHKT